MGILKSLIIPILVGICVSTVAACGDNRSPCDYTEEDDITNATMPEMTNLTVSGTGDVHVCGAFDGGHHDNVLNTVDVDLYQIDVQVPGALLVEIVGGDGVDQLHDIAVELLTTGSDATDSTIAAVGHYDPALSDHGAYAVTLPSAGTYDLKVVLYDSGDLSAPIDYRVRLAPMWACNPPTSPSYTEKSDATDGVVSVDYTKDPSFAMISGDSPESSGIHLGPTDTDMIAGSATAAQPAVQDEYLDRNTYAFTTGDDANEMAVSLNWGGTSSDLDFIVFESTALTPIVAGNTTSTSGNEFAVFGVEPNTTYWLWIGAYMGSTATSYNATMCGQHFFY